jgi:FHS family L-fucose permease-like MFS transporter
VPLERAGKLVAVYWTCAMVGRFAGSALLTRLPATTLLAIAAALAAALCLSVRVTHGPGAGVAALSIGLMNSIMFPVIFTLTLERTTASRAATSGLLCMAIVGGAFLPRLVGVIADAASLRAAYLVPLLAYACISAFAIAASRAALPAALPAPAHGGH